MKNIDSYLSRGGARVVIFGGAGAEHDISRLSAGGFISEARRSGLDVLPIFVDKNGDFYFYFGNEADISDIKREIDRDALVPTFPVRLRGVSGFFYGNEVVPISLAVPVLHGDYGEDGRVQGLLECAGVRFVGAGTISGALMCDKAYAKAVCASVGVRTLPWLAFSSEHCKERADEAVREIKEKIGLPAFIKPTGLGSSIGASQANSIEELYASVLAAAALSERVMAEPALQNKCELECAYFDMHGVRVITHPAQVLADGGFYDYGRKYFNTGRVNLYERADVPDSVAMQIEENTRVLAEAMGARHIARFDYFLAEDGELYFNEVNSFPGLTSGSLYTRMLAGAGIGYSDFVRLVLK